MLSCSSDVIEVTLEVVVERLLLDGCSKTKEETFEYAKEKGEEIDSTDA